MTRPSTPWPSRIALAILGWHALAGPCRAEVPMEQALGLYAATPKERRNLSPFWGMVAIRSGILANIRFFGGYGSTEQAGLPRHKVLKDPKLQCPLDPVAGVVQYLFPSRDGITLAHNQYGDKDPIGRVAEEARKLRAWRDGLRRLEGEGKKGSRDYLKAEHRFNQLHEARGLRRIQALLAAVASYRAQLGAAAGEETKAAGATGTAAAGIETKGSAPQAPSPAARAFLEAAGKALDRGKAEAGATADSSYHHLREGFLSHLQRAVQAEAEGADRLYPPNTVEMALLAYAWQAADSVDELYDAFAGHLLGKPPEGKARFDLDYYREQFPGFRERLSGSGHGAEGAGAPPTPEELFLFLWGNQAFTSPMCDLVGHANTSYDGHEFPDCGETALRNFLNIAFSRQGELDAGQAGEILARMKGLPGILAGDGAQGDAKVETKGSSLPTGSAHPVHPGKVAEIQAFYEEFKTIEAHRSPKAHLEWSRIVSNLNGAKAGADGPADPIPIRYVAGTYNLEGRGAPNMLNLIGHLLPDRKLNEPWPGDDAGRHRLAAEKLDRLCELVSTKERTFDWAVGGRKALAGDFADVAFTINHEPAFVWKFLERHFLIVPESARGLGNLAAAALAQTREPWLRVWLHPHDQTAGLDDGKEEYGDFDIRPLRFTTPGELYGYRLAADDSAEAVAAIAAGPKPELAPNLHCIVGRALPFDGYSLQALGNIFRRYPQGAADRRFYPLPWLLDRPRQDKDRMLLDLLKPSRMFMGDAFFLLVDHGARIDQRDEASRPLLCALIDRSPGTARRLVEARLAAVDTKDPGGETPLMLAVRRPLSRASYELTQALIKSGAEVNAALPDGRTALMLAAAVPRSLPIVQVLVDAGADLRARDRDGRTALDWAGLGKDQELQDWLRKEAETGGGTEAKTETRTEAKAGAAAGTTAP